VETDDTPAFPARFVPGLVLLRRGRAEWQLGLDPSAAVRVPAAPDGSAPRAEDLRTDPRAAALVVTAPPQAGAVPAGEAAAVLQRGPHRAGERLRLRGAARVEVHDDLGLDAAALLRDAGIAVVDQTSGGPPDVVLALCDREVDREVLDPLVRHGIPHLVVRLVDGAVTLGPFVVPGRTACLRCIDEHLAVGDPAHHSLVAQHARRSGATFDGARPRDQALLTMATAWAVRDVLTHVEGDRPTTWSATVRLEQGLAAVTDVHWLRHPECGCFWLDDGDASATLDP
jgi:bacteriocin biosynthesis cyclodehydratase domain-containing protein